MAMVEVVLVVVVIDVRRNPLIIAETILKL